jgi:polar amino acid transport system substrate-binding protein
MIFKKFVYLLVGLTLLVTGGLFLCKQTPKHALENDHLVVGVSADFPPFTFMQNDKIVGFDIDLIEAIGTRLGKKIELKNMPFSTLLPLLQLGHIQVVAAGLTATPERAKHVLFTMPYLEGEPLVMVSLHAAPAQSLADLNDKIVVVNEGYTADMYMSNITGPQLIRLQSPADAFLALKSGRAFAFVTAENTIKPFFAQYGSQQFHVAAIPNTSENASFAIAPQCKELRAQIQTALDALKADGTVQKIRAAWGL